MILGVRVEPSPPPQYALTRDQQTHRAAANALWRPLLGIESGYREWPHGTAYTVHDPTGNPRTGGHSTTPGITGPSGPRVEPADEGRIHGVIHPEDWPGTLKLGVRLTESTYTDARIALDDATIYEWRAAAFGSSSRQAFTLDANRHGNPRLRRNPKDAFVTPRVAAFLEALAALSFIEIITPELEDALITEDDISPTAVLAIMQRSGLTPSEE